MRLSTQTQTALFVVAGASCSVAAAFAPVDSFASRTGAAPAAAKIRLASSNDGSSRSRSSSSDVLGTFDPLNLADTDHVMNMNTNFSPVDESSSNTGRGMGVAAAMGAAAWAASSEVASANDSPDWGVFEGVSTLLNERYA